jgi:WD40 repeat protein
MNAQRTELIFNQGKSFWMKRDYSKALEYFLRVLKLSHRKDWLCQIALLTGGVYQIKKMTTGKYPLLSPNGKKIVFTNKDNNFCDIFIMDHHGNNKQKLIRVLSSDYAAPKFSPDGRYIGFTTNKKKISNIYLLNLKNKELRRLSRLKGNIASFVFSPDSKYLTFNYWTSNNAKIRLFNLETLEEIKKIVKEQPSYEPMFSPDGSRIIFFHKNIKNKVFIIIKKLSGNNRILQEVPKNIFPHLYCTPDSKYVIFGSVNGFYLLSINEAVKKRLSFYKCEGKCRNFSFSRNCKFAIFISEVNKEYRLNTMNFKNMKIKSIFESRAPLRWCSFLPNEKKIICAQSQGKFIDKLFLIDLSCNTIHPIDTDVPCGFRNIRGESNVSFYPDGKKILFAHSKNGDYRKPDQICQMDIQPLRMIKLKYLICRLKKLIMQERVMLKRAKLTFRVIHPHVKEMIEQVSQKNLKSYVKKLQNFGPRISGSDSCKKAANFLYNRFAKDGLDVQYDDYQHPKNKKFNSQNVIATITGRSKPEYIYIIGAHYDSHAGSPGAWDDASGIAVVLETARIMRSFQPEATIKFICFSGEELGNIGSKHFVRKAKKQNLHIHGVIDNDCIGYQTGDNMAVTLFYSSTPLLQVLNSASILYLDLLTYRSRSRERCGVIPFMHEFGNITVSIQDYPYLPSPYMHHPKDRVSSLFFPLIAEVTKINVAALTTVSVCPVPVKGIKIERQRNSCRLCISWKKNNEKDIKGYRIYYGRYPNIFDNVLDVGNINFYIMDNLAINKPCIISIRAYNRDGYESWGADELNINNYPLHDI